MCFESRSTQDLLTDQFGIKGRIRVKNEPTVSSQNTWEDGAALRSQELGVGVFPVLCGEDSEWAFEHVHLEFRRGLNWREKFWSPPHNARV